MNIYGLCFTTSIERRSTIDEDIIVLTLSCFALKYIPVWPSHIATEDLIKLLPILSTIKEINSSWSVYKYVHNTAHTLQLRQDSKKVVWWTLIT